MAFQDVIGHNTVVNLLKRALVNQRVNHAYLFVGPEGVGKELIAVQFAKAINCLKDTDDSCGGCRSCRKFASGNHPDFQIIRPAENSIGIEEIRALQKDMVYKPYESSRKIYIIDDAEMMTPEGANSLLKTLEEPPEYAVLILITAQKDSILPTLISRCQLIQFSKLSQEELRTFLQNQSTDVEDLKLEEILQLAEGSIGQAFKLLEDGQIWDDRKLLLDFLFKLGDKTNLEIYELLQNLNLGKDLRQWDRLLRIVKTFYRDLMILKTMDEPDLVINRSYFADMQQIKSQYSGEDLEKVIKLIERTNNVIMTNVDRELAFEVMLHKIKARRM